MKNKLISTLIVLALSLITSQTLYYQDYKFPVERDTDLFEKAPTKYQININADHFEKWQPIFAIKENKQNYQKAVRQIKEKLLEEGYMTPYWYSFVSNYSQYYKIYDEEMVKEMKMISYLSLVDFADVFTVNFIYELVAHNRSNSQMCTAMLIWGDDDIVKHIKNLDFNGAPEIASIMVQFDYVNDFEELIFSTNTQIGFITTSTAIRYGGYTVSVNERNKGYQSASFIEMVLGSWNVQYNIFKLLQTVDNYDEFVMNILQNSYIAPFYLTVASAQPGEGGILIQKGRNKETQIETLSKNNWVIVQTNCDISDEDPDGRRTIATQKVKDIGKGITNEQLYQISQEYPTFNNITISTYVINPQLNYFNTTIWYE